MDWDSSYISSTIERALAEDIGSGDITAQILFPDPPVLSALFLAKQEGILAGLPLVSRIFRRLDPNVQVEERVNEGDRLKSGTVFCRIRGHANALLAGERVTLNFLQRLSGIATQTGMYVAMATESGIKVLDTRKTTPTLRPLEKYAVLAGGGANHRFGLFDAILVKDNHLKLQPDFRKILNAFQEKNYSISQIEIEVASFEMLQRAVKDGARCFLLDNMAPAEIRRCVQVKQKDMYFEVSGGIHAGNFKDYLIPGIDAISIGALTHSVNSLDISMELE